MNALNKVVIGCFACLFLFAESTLSLYALDYAGGAALSFPKPALFPKLSEGQKQFLEKINCLILSTPHNRGEGVFCGSGRRTLFDRDGQAMPVITKVDKYTRH